MAKDERQKAFERELRRQIDAMGGRNILPDFMALGRAAGMPMFGGEGGGKVEKEKKGLPVDYKQPMNPLGRPNSKAPVFDKSDPKKVITGPRPTKNPVPKPAPKPGSATQAMPQPTAIRPESNDWEDIVKAYFPKTGGNVYKDGGLVRGGGAAQRGRGRGKMC